MEIDELKKACQAELEEAGVTLRDDPERKLAVFRLVIGKMPKEGLAKFRQVMLRANFLGGEIAGARLAVSSDDEIILSQTLPLAQTDGTIAASSVRRLSGVAEVWRQLLDDYPPAAARQKAEAEEDVRLTRRMVASAFLRA